jgi:hypothetical protein
MIAVPSKKPTVSVRMQRVAEELREIQDLLALQPGVDTSILTDFRDAVNRVRNTAWAVEQYANSQSTGEDPQNVVTLLAGERVRVAYQLCKLIQADLANPSIRFQKGQLLQFRDVNTELEQKLGEVVKR